LRALALHPQVYTKGRAEVLEVVGPTLAPTFDQMRELKYVRAIINETLRLWPILPYTRKNALQDLTLPTGGKNGGPVAVLKGTHLTLAHLNSLNSDG
jgi:cytochrome P450